MSCLQAIFAIFIAECLLLQRSQAIIEHPPEIPNSPDDDPRCRSNEYWHEKAQRCAEFCGDSQKCNVDEQCDLKTNTCQHSCLHLCDHNTQFCDPAMTACKDCSSICSVQEIGAYPCDAYCPNWDAHPAQNLTDGMHLLSTLNAMEYQSTEEPPKNIARHSDWVIAVGIGIAMVVVGCIAVSLYIVVTCMRSRRKQRRTCLPVWCHRNYQSQTGLEIPDSPLLAPQRQVPDSQRNTADGSADISSSLLQPETNDHRRFEGTTAHGYNQIYPAYQSQEEIEMIQVSGPQSSVISNLLMQDAQNSGGGACYDPDPDPQIDHPQESQTVDGLETSTSRLHHSSCVLQPETNDHILSEEMTVHDYSQIHLENQSQEVNCASSSETLDLLTQYSVTSHPSFTPYNSVDGAVSIPPSESDGPPAVRFANEHDPHVHHVTDHYNAVIREARGRLSWVGERGGGAHCDPALDPQIDHPQDWPKDSGCGTMRYGGSHLAIDDAHQPLPDLNIEPRHYGVRQVESREDSPIPDLQSREVTPSSAEDSDE